MTDELREQLVDKLMDYSTMNRPDAVRAVDAMLPLIDDPADEYDALLKRQSDLLSGVALAIKGPEPELTSWSHHDVVELAAGVVAQRDAALAALAQHEQQPPADQQIDARLRQIDARERAVTPGTWIAFRPDDGDGELAWWWVWREERLPNYGGVLQIDREPDNSVNDYARGGVGSIETTDQRDPVQEEADAIFIAGARSDIPWMSATIKALQARHQAVISVLADFGFPECDVVAECFEENGTWRLVRDLRAVLETTQGEAMSTDTNKWTSEEVELAVAETLNGICVDNGWKVGALGQDGKPRFNERSPESIASAVMERLSSEPVEVDAEAVLPDARWVSDN